MSDAPDWRALVAAEGADPDMVVTSLPYCCAIRAGVFDARIDRNTCGRWWFMGRHDDPAAAVRAALAYLRAEVRRRRDEMDAVLTRLGDTNT